MIPSIQQIFHLYYDHEHPMQRSGRRHVWKDFGQEFNDLDLKSKAEIKRIFKEEIVGKNALGTERTLKEYGTFAGLDFVTGEVFDNC